jgi:predicted site-specific integrase-resolvase
LEVKKINLIKVDKVNNSEINKLIKNNGRYLYARVSSLGQKADLERQENLLKEKYPNGKNSYIKNNKGKEPKEELVDDVLQIMNIFVAKINGMRKYEKNKIEK